MHVEKNASMATIARRAGWFWPDGTPAKNKVQRMVDKLVKGKLMFRVHGGKYRLTKAGCKVIEVKFTAMMTTNKAVLMVSTIFMPYSVSTIVSTTSTK